MEIVRYGIGWLLAIVAIATGGYYFFYNNRRKRLEIDARIDNLLVARVGHQDELEVRYNDRTISKPQIVEFRVTNVGHKDITSKDFDLDKPLEVGLGAEAVARLRISEDDVTSMLEVNEDDTKSLLVNPAKPKVTDLAGPAEVS